MPTPQPDVVLVGSYPMVLIERIVPRIPGRNQPRYRLFRGKSTDTCRVRADRSGPNWRPALPLADEQALADYMAHTDTRTLRRIRTR